MTLGKVPFENIVGKGDNAGNQHFLLFPQCFHPITGKYHLLRDNGFVVCKYFKFGSV